MNNRIGRLLLSAVLAAVTFWIVGLFPDSNDWAYAAALPGAYVASLFYPEGIHSDGRVEFYIYIGIVVNFLIYGFVWFGILALAAALRRRGQNA